MLEKALTPAAFRALEGPLHVEYHDDWPDTYSVDGQVPSEDEQEWMSEDQTGRHDVRRRAISLLPEALCALALCRDLLVDLDDLGELDETDGETGEPDHTSRRGRRALEEIARLFADINVAAAPYELEEVEGSAEGFRAWLSGKGLVSVGLPDSPTLNPVALFLEQKHGVPVWVEDGVVRLGHATRKRTQPYMDRFLWTIGRVYGGPVSAPGALRILDLVLEEEGAGHAAG